MNRLRVIEEHAPGETRAWPPEIGQWITNKRVASTSSLIEAFRRFSYEKFLGFEKYESYYIANPLISFGMHCFCCTISMCIDISISDLWTMLSLQKGRLISLSR